MADFAALAEAHLRQLERDAMVIRERQAHGCFDRCRFTETEHYGAMLMIYRHLAPDGSAAELEMPHRMRHWRETTVLSREVLEWLRTLHPVCDTVTSESEATE